MGTPILRVAPLENLRGNADPLRRRGPGTRQISIGQPTDAQPMIELNQQGQASMGPSPHYS